MSIAQPPFLNSAMAKSAVDAAVVGILGPHSPIQHLWRKPEGATLYIVVLNPLAKVFSPEAILYEYRHNEELWTEGSIYDQYAQSKAGQLLEGRNDDQTEVFPHLLKEGDFCLWGGAKTDGIPVGASGERAEVDKYVSRVVGAGCSAISRFTYLNWRDENPNERCVPGIF